MSNNIPVFKFLLNDNLESSCIAFNERHPNIEPLRPSSFLPCRSESQATGYDVRCAEPNGVEFKPYSYVKIPLGFRAFSPDGWWLKLTPRSSTMIKRKIHALYGVIDESYENQFFFVGQYIPDVSDDNSTKSILFGERIAQLIPVKRETMGCEIINRSDFDSLSSIRNGSRGVGGFGSTGSF